VAASETQLARGATMSDYARMIWQRRWVVVATVLLASAVALVTRPPEPAPLYVATSTLRVQTFTFSGSGTTGITPVEGVPPAEVEAARSVEVAAETAEELGYSDNGADLLTRLAVSAPENSDLMQLRLTGEGAGTVEELRLYGENYEEFRNAQDEERLQRALAEVDERIAEVDQRLQRASARFASEEAAGGASPETRTKFDTLSALYTSLVNRKELLKLDSALAGGQVELIGSPIGQRLGAIPTRTLRMLAGPLGGLLLGCALATALGVLRPRLSGRDRTEEQLGYPVLATIPRIRNRRLDKDPLIVQRASGWGAEGIRMLRTELQLVEERGPSLKTLIVASPEPRDGKSTVAGNLAAAYAATGRATVLVHADLRAARRHKDGPGLTDFITGRTPDLQVQRHPAGFAEVLAGTHLGSHSGSMQEGLVGAIRRLGSEYEVVIVDTPPLLAFADALLLAAEGDAVVLVVRDGKTMEDKAAEALEVLVRHDAAVAGLVLNAASVGRLERRRYRRYYGTWREPGEPAEAFAPEAAPPPPPPAAPANGHPQPVAEPPGAPEVAEASEAPAGGSRI
jgi:Mrp family chromosome partitioning ATPase